MSTPLNILLCNLPSFHKHCSNEKPFPASLSSPRGQSLIPYCSRGRGATKIHREIAGKVKKIVTEIFKTTEGGNGLSEEKRFEHLIIWLDTRHI